MKTIDKALRLLGFFTIETPEYRLSDIARAADVDKATALRILNSLSSGGLVEHDPDTKKYRLGTAVLRLARIRETCSPIVSVLQPLVDRLAESTGESAHAGLPSDNGIATIAICEPNRATRVRIEQTQILPFNATASGLVFLAFSSTGFADRWLSKSKIQSFTDETLVDAADVKKRLADIKSKGFAYSAGSFEPDVVGFAAPVFDWHLNVVATIAVACVRSRLTSQNRKQIENLVVAAAAEATATLGG